MKFYYESWFWACYKTKRLYVNRNPSRCSHHWYSYFFLRHQCVRTIKIILLFDYYSRFNWLRGTDLNRRPQGYEPCELPGCSTPR